jgi:hypothetical protein
MRDRLLVIGSDDGQDVDVWALDLTGPLTWEKLVTSDDPPQGRWGHSVVYDPVRDCVILCGGSDWTTYPQAYLSDVWVLSLSSLSWLRIASDRNAPEGREGHGALYDPERQRMILFGGRYDDVSDGTHHFLNDLWELTLGDSATWSEIEAEGTIPGARSAFGTVYDPVRRRMLVHGGVNPQGGVEPDELWALTLEGAPAWSQIVTENALRARSYPVDVYDPDGDRLLACGGRGYPQTSALPLADPVRWEAVLPPDPLATPGPRAGDAVVHDTRRDGFLVMGGSYSSVDSAMWSFDLRGTSHWRPLSTPAAPSFWFGIEPWQSTVYDSLADRTLLFDGYGIYTTPAEAPRDWVLLGPPAPAGGQEVGLGAGVALDTRRNRLLVTGGWLYYPHGVGYTVTGVWALSLGVDLAWTKLGDLPMSSGSHATYYDAANDRLVLLGGYEVADLARTRHSHGPIVWTTPLDSALVWTLRKSTSGELPLAPPDAYSAFDPKGGRLYIASDSTVWTRLVDDTGPWTKLDLAGARPVVTSTIAFDPVEDQLLALFASASGSTNIQAWALAVGPLSLSWLESRRAADAVHLRCRSVTAYGQSAVIERREESTDWSERGPLAFDEEGLVGFTDHDISAGHDYHYRVSVSGDAGVWHSAPVFVPDPASLQLALLGARPQPAVGIMRLSFSLPTVGPARLEVFDIRGRRCLSRDVGGLGPGIHSVHLAESAAWRPGVYYARLTRGGEARTSRVVLMR